MRRSTSHRPTGLRRAEQVWANNGEGRFYLLFFIAIFGICGGLDRFFTGHPVAAAAIFAVPLAGIVWELEHRRRYVRLDETTADALELVTRNLTEAAPAELRVQLDQAYADAYAARKAALAAERAELDLKKQVPLAFMPSPDAELSAARDLLAQAGDRKHPELWTAIEPRRREIATATREAKEATDRVRQTAAHLSDAAAMWQSVSLALPEKDLVKLRSTRAQLPASDVARTRVVEAEQERAFISSHIAEVA